jgi:4-amino-4-deoxy-L-arabinose transferase-like glycosyltransferase
MLKRKLKLSPKGQPVDPRAFSQFLDLMDNHPFQVIGMILMLGVVFSVIVMASHPPSLRSGETDSWWTIALNLKHGHGYSLCLTQYFPFCGPSNQVTAMREPVPVFLFAMAAWLGGESLWTVAVVEVIIYLAMILSIYFLTRAWADTRSAVIASFLWVIYLPALELIPQASGDLPAALCTTLGILFTLRARKTGLTRDWIFAGISLGFAVLSRSATLVIPLFVVGGQTIESWRQNLKPKDILRPTLVISALVILFMAPWLIRNRVALGRPILGSSLTGYNLYRHNYMIQKDHYVRYAGSEEAAQAIENLVSQYSDLRGNENEAQMDLIYRNEALKIIESHPGQYVLLSAYRILPLWFDWKIAEAYGHPTNRYGYLIMTLQATLLILAIVGLQKRANVTWPLWGSILAVSAVYMAVDARLLYVMPMMPLVLSLSAVGANKLLEKVFG